jgi:hypothetical protein
VLAHATPAARPPCTHPAAPGYPRRDARRVCEPHRGWQPAPHPAGAARAAALASRRDDIDRIIADYAADAIAELAAPATGFTDRDHVWVREHAATSLDEIEKATLRVIAIRTSETMGEAAARLGMAQPSLLRWIDRRRRPGQRAATRRTTLA